MQEEKKSSEAPIERDDYINEGGSGKMGHKQELDADGAGSSFDNLPSDRDLLSPSKSAKLNGKKGLTILLTSFSDMGHFIPLVHMAEEMERRNHTVHIMTTSYGVDKCRKFADHLKADVFASRRDNLSKKEFQGGGDDQGKWLDGQDKWSKIAIEEIK